MSRSSERSEEEGLAITPKLLLFELNRSCLAKTRALTAKVPTDIIEVQRGNLQEKCKL